MHYDESPWLKGYMRCDVYAGRILIRVGRPYWWAQTLDDVKSVGLWETPNLHNEWFTGDDIEGRRYLSGAAAEALGLIRLIEIADKPYDNGHIRYGRVGSARLAGFACVDYCFEEYCRVRSDLDDLPPVGRPAR